MDRREVSTTAVKFPATGPIRTTIVTAVKDYLDEPGVRAIAYRKVQTKAAIVSVWAMGSYLALVLAAHNWWQAVLYGLSLSLSLNAVGFNVMHDGNHGGFSAYSWLNRAAGYTLDPMGGSSYVWRVKHNIAHHIYTNVEEYDADIALAPFGRMSTEQPQKSYHRFQKYYLFFFYCFMTIRWQIVNDFQTLKRGKVGESHIEWPKGPRLLKLKRGSKLVLRWQPTSWGSRDFYGFWVGKTAFVTLAFILPLATHWSWFGIWMCLLAFLGVSAVFSFVLALTFQLAHCVDEALFASPDDIDPQTGKMRMEWFEYQIRTTANFCPNSRVLTWFLGGLNYQLEHHLFRDETHIHYPAIAKIVRQKCAELGLPYMSQPTLVQAIKSHYRHLNNMGLKPTTVAQ